MNDLDPYMDYDEPGSYAERYGDKSAKDAESAAEESRPEQQDFAPVMLQLHDSRRIGEVDIPVNKAARDVYGYPAYYSRYKKDLTSAVHHDSARKSLHPLGVTERPAGVDIRTWHELDIDGIFSEEEAATAETPAAGISPAGETYSPAAAPSGGGGGGPVGYDEDEDDEHDPSEMPFLDHLEEFRWALLKSITAIVIAMLAAWFLSDTFITTVTRLAQNAQLNLVYNRTMEAIMIRLQTALFMGVAVALPFVLYFVWSFVSPGLYKREKKYILPLVFASTVCFFIGASLAYFIIIPFVLKFIKGFMVDGVMDMLSIGDFILTVLKFTILFGVLFQLPLISFILAKIGLIRHTWMKQYRKYAIIVIFVIGAILTPPDPLSQIMMAAPLILLYEISILVARFAGKKTVIGV